MSIRCTAKAVILREGRILLTRCRDDTRGEYYALPGGGQNQYETLEEALRRECLEETGLVVRPLRFLALYEEICLDPILRSNFPDYAHKMYHVFLCRAEDAPPQEPREQDLWQTGLEWVEAARLPKLRIFPWAVGQALPSLLEESAAPRFLGTVLLPQEPPA